MNVRNLLLMLLVSLCCCNKDTTKQQTTTTQNQPFAFTVQYDSVITLVPNSNYNYVFTIKVQSGDISQNQLSCSLTGLPAEAAVSPSTITVGLVQTGAFNISTANVNPGTYTIQLVVASAAKGTQKYNIKLIVAPAANYAPILAGNYAGCYDYCVPPDSMYYYSSVVSAIADTPYKMKISNIRNFGSSFVVRAWASGGVTIPVQTVSGITIWGSGTYSHDSRAAYSSQYQMTINDTVVSGVDTQRCTIHIQH